MKNRVGQSAPAIALAALLITQPLAAQTARASNNPRWHISLYAGTNSPGPAADLRAALVREDYNQSVSCAFLGCAPHTYPYSVTGWGQTGLPFTAEVHFRFVGPAELGLIVGRTPIGETVGYHYPLEVDIQYGVTVLAPTAGFSIPLPLPRTPVVNIGAGPAWYGAFWTPFRDKNALPTGHENTVGMVAQAGFEVPVDKGVRVGFDFQYRSVGTVTVGPVPLPIAVNRHDLPAMPSNFDHWYAALGFSVDL